MQVEIVDMNGKVCAVDHYSNLHESEIIRTSLSNFNTGIYLLRVIGDGESSSIKILKN
jgi:hypothetical protein